MAEAPAEAEAGAAEPVVPVGWGGVAPVVPVAPAVPEVPADAAAPLVAGLDGFDVLPVLTAGFIADDDEAADEGLAEAGDAADGFAPPAACSNSFRCERNSTSLARIAGSSCALAEGADGG